MGTRNLTMVINQEGTTKVAQYGQWDGYPSGQGITILNFLSKDGNQELLQKTLSKVRFLDSEGVDKEFIESYNKNAPEWSSDPDKRTDKQIAWWQKYQHRNIAGEILENIINSTDEEIILTDKSNFGKDSLFCEYAYVVDFSKGTYEVYEGFNKEELLETERFYGKKEDEDEYYGCKLLKTYKLSELPTKEVFLNETELVEEED